MTAALASARTVAGWLADLGLGVYAARFQQAEIEMEVLPHLTDADLKELGVHALGHRRKILARAAQLADGEARDLDAAERRYLTVMFCDLVGSTRLAERLGAEPYSEVLGAYYRAVEAAIEPFGGHVAQYLGDGVLVYFGYPNVVEDAALCAVTAARNAVGAVARLTAPNGERLAARIGLATGNVVIDGLRSGWSQGGGRAFGATVNLAARLQSEARPGGIILSEATAALVGDRLEVTPLGPRQLKGIDPPCAVFQVGGEDAAATEVAPVVRPGRVRFINRRAELSRLTASWARAARGGSALVAIAGEPGIGKSRLVTEFLARLRRKGHPVRRIACPPEGQDTPFHALMLALEQEGSSDGAGLICEVQAETAVSQSERRLRRARLIDRLCQHLAGPETEARALWIDDLQWADPSTRETLDRLIASAPQGVMVLITSREAAEAARMAQACDGLFLPLGALEPDDTGSLIADVFAGVPEAAPVVRQVIERAEGVPLFAEELALEMRARLSASGTAPAEGPKTLPIPSSLQQSLQARIGRLTHARPLLRLAASTGREASIPLLRDLWPGPGPIEPALEEIVASGLAQLHPAPRPGGEDRLVLRHQLICDCAYDMILRRDRVRIHGAIADALDRRAAAGVPVAQTMRADQLERADRPCEAAKLWAEAGRRAAQQSADAEAVALYRKALALLPGADDPDWAEKFEADTLLALFPALIGAEGYRAAGTDVIQRVNALIARTGGARRVFSSLFFQWIGMVAQGDIDTAHEFAFGLSGVVGDEDSGLHQMMLRRMIGSTHMFRGEFPEARHQLQRFLQDYDPARHAEPLRQFGATDNHTTVLCCLAAIEAIDGSAESSRRATARALRAAEDLGHTHTLCHTLTFGCALPAGIRRDWEALARHTGRLAAIAGKRELAFWIVFSEMLTGIQRTATGALEEGFAAFENARGAFLAQGFRFMVPTFTLVQALARNETRPVPDAELAAIEQALAAGERWLLGTCRQLRVAGS